MNFSSELEAKIEDELEKMRAKLGGRYAKFAKSSNSPGKPRNDLTNTLIREEYGASKTVTIKNNRTSILSEKGSEDIGNLPYLM